jgi:hypothetical protein
LAEASLIDAENLFRQPGPLQHAAGNLDNRHVEIVCAASARVNVSVLYQFVDTANPALAY